MKRLKYKNLCNECMYNVAGICLKTPTRKEFRGDFEPIKCWKNNYRFFRKGTHKDWMKEQRRKGNGV